MWMLFTLIKRQGKNLGADCKCNVDKIKWTSFHEVSMNYKHPINPTVCVDDIKIWIKSIVKIYQSIFVILWKVICHCLENNEYLAVDNILLILLMQRLLCRHVHFYNHLVHLQHPRTLGEVESQAPASLPLQPGRDDSPAHYHLRSKKLKFIFILFSRVILIPETQIEPRNQNIK